MGELSIISQHFPTYSMVIYHHFPAFFSVSQLGPFNPKGPSLHLSLCLRHGRLNLLHLFSAHLQSQGLLTWETMWEKLGKRAAKWRKTLGFDEVLPLEIWCSEYLCSSISRIQIFMFRFFCRRSVSDKTGNCWQYGDRSKTIIYMNAWLNIHVSAFLSRVTLLLIQAIHCFPRKSSAHGGPCTLFVYL